MSPGTLPTFTPTTTAQKPLFQFRLPPPQPQSPPRHRRLQQRSTDTPTLVGRREAAVLLSILSVFQSSPAPAFTFGISGPKDWLREQKKKSSKFILAPIDASRNSLRTAYLLLTNENDDFGDKELGEVRRLLKSAARDCVPEERNSLVSFQATTGVEVCTFRLVVNNASSLLDNKDPVKLEAEAKLNDLIKSFSVLGSLANVADIQQDSSRQKVADALRDTISSLETFEQGIKDCLQI